MALTGVRGEVIDGSLVTVSTTWRPNKPKKPASRASSILFIHPDGNPIFGAHGWALVPGRSKWELRKVFLQIVGRGRTAYLHEGGRRGNPGYGGYN